jgi:hypothetical protein
MAFFVDCILQQYLNFKRITTVPHQEDIALFLKSDKLTTPSLNYTNNRDINNFRKINCYI